MSQSDGFYLCFLDFFFGCTLCNFTYITTNYINNLIKNFFMTLKIVKEVRDIARFRQILHVLFEEGFDFLLEKIRLKHKIPITKRLKARLEKKKDFSFEKRLRVTLERLGPTFIKFGQVLSVRPDLIPKSYIKELEKLQDEVMPFTFKIVEQQIRKELHKPINELFSKFDKEPIASASISQVHKAVLKNGKKVAVKIQRPEARKLMETDIEIMLYIAKLLEKRMPNLKKYNPVSIVKEFEEWTKKELDFKKEAVNAKIFRKNFKGNKSVTIPEVYDELTTEKILTLEYLDGIELHNIKEIKRKKLNFDKIMKNGFDAVLIQVFMHGFFHADPHPGNILVQKNNSIAFVDFGIVGHFNERLKDNSANLFYGVVNNDAELIADTLIGMGVDSEEINKEELKYEIEIAISQLQNQGLGKSKVSSVLEDVMDIALRYGIKMPIDFVLFGKTIITLEGIALQYDPNFKIIDSSKPFIEKLMKQRYSPVKLANNFIRNITEFKRYIGRLPEETTKALRKIQKGTIKVDIEDTDIKKLSLEIDRSSNRISYALIITAFLIVGAGVIIADKGPALFNVPALALVSFLGAAILTIILFISILKEVK